MKEVKKITLTGKYLSESMAHLPSGIINKKYTGIGATHLELSDTSRNSVIVVPTRSLASSKATDGILYFGGRYNGKIKDSIETVIDKLNNGETIKIMAVADSFVELFQSNQELFLRNFHLVIDEIDSFQSESDYRQSLSDCIDIYKLFPQHKRTMISATLLDFMDKNLQNENVTEFVKVDHQPLGLDLIRSDGHFEADIAEVIKSCMNKNPTGNILIAYNSIDGILKVIANLDMESLIGVLCSEENIRRFPPQMRISLNNGKLEKQITFITSAFFVGIDIIDKADVIVAGNCKTKFTMLPESKIIQIFGRIRHEDSNKTLIYNVNRKLTKEIRQIKREINAITKSYLKFINNFLVMRQKLNKSRKVILPNVETIINVLSYNGIQLFRMSQITNKVDINWLAIDFMIHLQEAANNIYSKEKTAAKHFLNHHLLKVINSENVSSIHTIAAESRYKKLRKTIESEELAELKTYIAFLNYSGYGYVPTCPPTYYEAISDIEDTARIINQNEAIKRLLEKKIETVNSKELNKIANNLRLLRCWSDPLLKSKLEYLIKGRHGSDSESYRFDKEEIRSLLETLKNQIEKISVQSIDISKDKTMCMLIGKLFVFSRVGKRKLFVFKRAKNVEDYLNEI